MIVELKNDLSVQGTLKSVDQFLNIKLDDISVLEEVKYPHLVSITLSGVVFRLGFFRMVSIGRGSGRGEGGESGRQGSTREKRLGGIPVGGKG